MPKHSVLTGAELHTPADHTIDSHSDVSAITEAQGQIIYYGGSTWDALTAGTDGYYLKAQGAAADPIWVDIMAGIGAASSTDNAVPRFHETGGKLLQDSGVLIDDSDNVTIPGKVTITGLPTGATVADGPFYINPTSASADETIFGVALNGSERFRVDEDGDVSIVGQLDANQCVIKGVGSDAYFTNDGAGSVTFFCGGTSNTSGGYFTAAGRSFNGGWWGVRGISANQDESVTDCIIQAPGAMSGASVNQDGGRILIYAGDHAAGGGVEGSVIIAHANGSTPIATFIEDLATLNAKTTFNETASFDAETDNGNSGATDTIDWGAGNKQKSTLTDDCTYTFTAPAGPCNLILKLVQDGTGSRDPTWPGTVKWPASTEPTWSTGINAVDIVAFYYDGTNYYGLANMNFG